MAQNNPGQQLNDLLITRNFDPQALDSQGKPATDTANATVFSFDYKGESGQDYGTVAILLGESHDMCVYFGDNVGKSMEGDDKKGWFDFLQQLRQFSKRNLLTFSLQNLNKLKYSMQGQAAIKEGIFESWQGKKDVSYNADATQARLMIKHKRNLGEADARFRYIESLFIETADGERWKMPFKSLTAGKAMLEHVRQGGRPYDVRGNHIATIVEEMNLLSRFRRANQGRIFEGETAQLVEQATEHYTNLHHALKSLCSKTGYQKYFESWNPAELSDEDVIIEDLRHMFIEQNIDSRIEQALPLLAKLKQEQAMKEINVFEGWMNLLSEGTWALPDTPEKQSQLIALLGDELTVGPDATNATEQLYDILGDDELFNRLGELAQQDANADARTVILDRLEQMKTNPSVAQVIGKLKIEQTPPAEQPEQDLKEFAPGTGHGDEDHLLKLAKQWAQASDADDDNGIDQAEAALDKFGYSISEIEDGSGNVQLVPTGEYMIDWNDDDIVVFHPDQLDEASDTVKLGPDGKPVAWSHEGDWEKSPTRNGKPVDPRGKVTNMAGQELARAKKIANLKESENSPVESAILGRIMNTQTGLLAKYGPQAVMDAARDEAEWVGDVDEIGSSDVSGWVNNVVRNLEAGQNNQPKLEETDVAARVHKLNLDMLDLLDQAKTASPQDKSQLKHQFQAAKKERNKLLGGTLADSPKGVLDELSSDTLKSYVKHASSDRAMRNFDQGVDTGSTFQDREPKFDWHNSRKDDQRRKGIHKALDRLEESGMGEVDLLLQEIARGTVDIFNVYSAPKSNVEKFVSDQIHDRVEELTNKRPELRHEADIDKVLGIIQADLENEYGIDEGVVGRAVGTAAGMALAPEIPGSSMIGGYIGDKIGDKISGDEVDEDKYNDPLGHNVATSRAARMLGYERFIDVPNNKMPQLRALADKIQKEKHGVKESTVLTGQYGHTGRLEPVQPQDADMMDRIKFLAGITK